MKKRNYLSKKELTLLKRIFKDFKSKTYYEIQVYIETFKTRVLRNSKNKVELKKNKRLLKKLNSYLKVVKKKNIEDTTNGIKSRKLDRYINGGGK